ncbi:MAG: PIN domain-containing protein [Acidobacteria bacterium]|nr:PIN domain-containing protein [Acidobacteriota bacterium]
MKYILDSGYLYARLNNNDIKHECVISTSLPRNKIVYFPIPAITEVAYLLGRDLGIGAVATFVRELSETDIILEPPAPEDYLRSSDILRKYNDNNIDFVDACIVAMAERLNITKILTVDHRHFRIFKPEHCESFELIPEAL